MLTLNNFLPTHDEFLPILVTKHLAIRAVAYKELNHPPTWRWQEHYLTLFYGRLQPGQRTWCQQQLMEQQEVEGVNGRIWQNKQTGQFYRRQHPLPRLTPLEENILAHLIEHVNERQTLSQIVAAGWHGDVQEYVSDDCIYQIIYRLRKKIEINPAQPHYILNWRGQPEGGYLLHQDGEGL